MSNLGRIVWAAAGILIFALGSTATTVGPQVWSLFGSMALVGAVLLVGSAPVVWSARLDSATAPR